MSLLLVSHDPPDQAEHDLHDIRGTLNTRSLALFPVLQQSPQFGRKDFKYPSIGILIDKGPVEIEYY